jgi:hypothetical protein
MWGMTFGWQVTPLDWSSPRHKLIRSFRKICIAQEKQHHWPIEMMSLSTAKTSLGIVIIVIHLMSLPSFLFDCVQSLSFRKDAWRGRFDVTPPPPRDCTARQNGRRHFLTTGASLSFWLWSGPQDSVLTTTPKNTAYAIDEGGERMVLRRKPTAPTAALLPAIQQRLLLEAAL